MQTKREQAENSGESRYDNWLRLPSKPGARIHGLSRAAIYELINANKIRSANIRKPGNIKGIRLVWEQSLIDYIERHVETEGSEATTGTTNQGAHNDR